MAKRRMSKKQREWCKNYERQTTFDPLMDDFYAGNESFVEAARKSVLWFEDWAADAHLSVCDIPGADRD